MYQTVLKSVAEGCAIGANGERLIFVGPFPARAGSRVWTDGRVIFGYVMPCGGGFVFPTSGGIPVLCDNRKGYFTKKGVWKNYPVAEYDFITNNKNNFFGGNNINQQGEKIFDAVINDNGEIFSVRWSSVISWTHNILDDLTNFLSYWKIKIYQNDSLIQSLNICDICSDVYSFCEDYFSHEVGNGSVATELLSVTIDKDGNLDFFIFASACKWRYKKNSNSKIEWVSACGLYHVVNGQGDRLFFQTCGNGEATRTGEINFSQNVGDGNYTMNKFGQITFYDSDENILAENIPIHDDFCYGEIDSCFVDTLTTSQINYTLYTSDGNSQAKTIELDNFLIKFDTAYNATSPTKPQNFFGLLTDTENFYNAFTLKPIIKKLSDGKYLFGNHGGKLYLKTGDNIQEVGDNLKNFRLEELKNMKKAKESEN